MNAWDYLDWTELSGIYVRQYSHGDRYRTFKKRISPEGLNTLIVAEFLKDNPGNKVDVAKWRTYSVYEAGGDKRERIELTAAALEAIGAHSTAQQVRRATSQSPLERLIEADDLETMLGSINPMEMLGHLRESVARLIPEGAGAIGLPPQSEDLEPSRCDSWQTVAELLEAYVAEHQQKLQDDLAKHGDPRTKPGYTRPGRLKELDQERAKLILRESQMEDIPKLRNLIKDLEKRFGGGQKVDARTQQRLRTTRQKFLDLLKENQKRASEEPVREMTAFLKEAEEFMQANPAIFKQKPPGDAKLQKRLDALGAYERRECYGETHLVWEKPTGFDVPWHHFELLLSYPQGGEKKALPRLLDVAERTQRRLDALSEQWRADLIAEYRDQEAWYARDEPEVGDDGLVSESRILEMVDAGRIGLLCYDQEGEEIRCDLAFNVEWDEEHGFNLEWEDVSPEDAEPAGVQFSPGKIKLTQTQPAISQSDLDALQRQFEIKLPEEYRSFLLAYNGGVPEPNHFTIQVQGDLLPFDVEHFFSVTSQAGQAGDDGNAPPASSLQVVLKPYLQTSLPNLLLPIARLKRYGLYMSGVEDYLFFILAGKKVGQLVLFDSDPVKEVMSDRRLDDKARAREFEAQVQYGLTAAKSLSKLFAKLKQKPEQELPQWLQMIQQDDRAGFLAWLDGGGTLRERFQEYGEFAPSSIVDYLTRDASAELLAELIERKLIQPKDIRSSWQDRYRYDVDRFRQLMPILPKQLWPYVMESPHVWDHVDLLEKLAEAKVDFNMPVAREGLCPIHLAVQWGHQQGVRWLMDHGADPHKKDRYGRTAFVWAEHEPGAACLPILKGQQEAGSAAAAIEESPAIIALRDAGEQLPDDVGLVLSIEIKSPPVTHVEKVYYQECHYRLSIDVRRNQVTYKDVTSPRQDYLYASGWPATLYAVTKQWPELTPLWETLSVKEFDWNKARKQPGYQGTDRPELLTAARAALQQGFDPQQTSRQCDNEKSI